MATFTAQRSEAWLAAWLFFLGLSEFRGTYTPPPTSGDLLCKLLEADGSPLRGGPVGAFPEVGVPRVQLGRKACGYSARGPGSPGRCSGPLGAVAAPPRPTCSLRGSDSARDDHRGPCTEWLAQPFYIVPLDLTTQPSLRPSQRLSLRPQTTHSVSRNLSARAALSSMGATKQAWLLST